MSNELRSKLEKQADRIELLEEELRSVHEALEERSLFAANLERDLEHLIIQMQSKTNAVYLSEHETSSV